MQTDLHELLLNLQSILIQKRKEHLKGISFPTSFSVERKKEKKEKIVQGSFVIYQLQHLCVTPSRIIYLFYFFVLSIFIQYWRIDILTEVMREEEKDLRQADFGFLVCFFFFFSLKLERKKERKKSFSKGEGRGQNIKTNETMLKAGKLKNL